MADKPAGRWFRSLLAFGEGVLERLSRGVVWLFLHAFYRIRVVGLENIPKKGPALLVCNHVSWLDGLFLGLSLRRRVRLLVWAPFARVPVLRYFMRLGRAIPIAAEAGPRAIVAALREASDALARGELVGIFAEGAITRTGFMLPFHRGFEQILKKTPVPVIPTCLDRLWGSIFSYRGGKLFWKWPRQIPYPVTLMFGKPMPPPVEAWQVRQEVQKLLADSFNLRRRDHKPVHRQFVRMACRHPLRPCIIDLVPQKRKLNYGKALTGGILLAQRLRPKLGDRQMIGLLLPTTGGGALANVAIALLGKIAVNLNYTASRESVQSAVQQCNIRHVITARAFRDKIQMDLPDVEWIYLEDVAREIGKVQRTLTFLSVVLLPGWFMEYVVLRLGRQRSDDLATIIFSSGTTGDPKGVMLSQHNITANIESMSQAIDLSPRDRLLAVLPFFHSFGYTVALWLPLLVGASIVYYPDPRQAKEIGEYCKRYRCTLFLSTPTFLRFLIRRCQPDDFATLRLLITGAEKLPRAVAEEFEQKFHLKPLEGYGCTELSPVASSNVPDWDQDGYRQIGQKPGSIGQPIPGVAVRVVDLQKLFEQNTLESLPPGREGMLIVYGPNVMVGYLNRPKETSDAIRDGWYVTGDVASLDEEGFITITGRMSRFSKIAGEMVPHERVEEEIQREIQQVMQTSERVCAVAGVRDRKKGERLVVLHTPLNGVNVQELQARLVDTGLPNLWLPDAKSYYQVQELPVLGSGKLDLQKLNQLARQVAEAPSE